MNSESTNRTPSTRHVILAAAGRALRQIGPSASLDAIADEAGVSKGGVLYHFKSKDALLRSLAVDVIETFRQRVHRKLDLSENVPGKMLRAYVRTIAEDIVATTGSEPRPERWGALLLIPGVAQLFRDDDEGWRAAFLEDGLDQDRALLVWRAADGLLGAALTTGRCDDAEVRSMCDLLIRLTHTNSPF